jgi:protein-tyrosine phosphatase
MRNRGLFGGMSVMKLHFATILVFAVVTLPVFAETLTLLAPPEGAIVSQLNEVQERFQHMPRQERVMYFEEPSCRKEMLLAGYYPTPVTFKWEWDGPTNAVFSVTLATDPAFAHTAPVSPLSDSEATADNLLIATKYYWRLTASTAAGSVSTTGTFTTADQTPRFLRVGKVSNIRDLGGYKTLDGRRVRQNLLFRSAGLNENAHTDWLKPGGFIPGKTRLSPDGLRYILDSLGVKSDIDLRSDGECRGMTGSPLGPSVKWFHFSSSAYDEIQEPKGRAAFANVFKALLDEGNYPVLFHCAAGQDRAGAVAFILNGLLGVPEEDLWLDWENSGFRTDNLDFRHDRRFYKLLKGFAAFPGTTMNEKVESYVLSLGFTQTDISRFRDMMLE